MESSRSMASGVAAASRDWAHPCSELTAPAGMYGDNWAAISSQLVNTPDACARAASRAAVQARAVRVSRPSSRLCPVPTHHRGDQPGADSYAERASSWRSGARLAAGSPAATSASHRCSRTAAWRANDAWRPLASAVIVPSVAVSPMLSPAATTGSARIYATCYPTVRSEAPLSGLTDELHRD